MKIGTCRYLDTEQAFVTDGEAAYLPALDPSLERPEFNNVLQLIQTGPAAWKELAKWAQGAPQTARQSLNDLEILAPISKPTKNVMCLGWNYSEHVSETADAAVRKAELPKHPVVFTKSVTSVTGPFTDIPYDKSVSQELDWEVELGVVIGTPAHRLTKQEALACIFGYTIINDISARDLQFRHEQFFIGKSLPGACPIGPWIVTANEISDPQNLDLRCLVNNETKQSSNTRYMIFDITTTIEILSKSMVLEPGDIIATGTPSGVGFTRKPPQFLAPGDVVECEVAEIGMIRNRIVG